MGKKLVQPGRRGLEGIGGLMYFWTNVNMNGNLPEHNKGLGRCWLWRGGLNQDGYGRFMSGGIRRMAHRHSYELKNGPVPKGKELDHLCRVRHCVRPRHLKAKTRLEHIHAPGSLALVRLFECNPNKNKTHCPKGHPYSKENTYINVYRSRGGGKRRVCKTCSKTRAANYYVRRGKSLRASRRK